MFDTLDTEKLMELGEKHGVKLDRRWRRERIVAALKDAKVKEPRAPVGSEKLSDKVDCEPVRFIGGIGSIRVRNAKYDADRMLIPGLVVHFLDGQGEPVGGISREFYPDLPDHEDTEECQCAQCLTAVRDYLTVNRLGRQIAEQYKIVEIGVNDPVQPFGGWGGIAADDIADLHAKIGFDLDNAMRFEKKHYQRADVIAALDACADKGEEVEAGDILTAEVEV